MTEVTTPPWGVSNKVRDSGINHVVFHSSRLSIFPQKRNQFPERAQAPKSHHKGVCGEKKAKSHGSSPPQSSLEWPWGTWFLLWQGCMWIGWFGRGRLTSYMYVVKSLVLLSISWQDHVLVALPLRATASRQGEEEGVILPLTLRVTITVSVCKWHVPTGRVGVHRIVYLSCIL